MAASNLQLPMRLTLLAAVLVTGACNGADAAPATTRATTTSSAPTTTAAPTTTSTAPTTTAPPETTTTTSTTEAPSDQVGDVTALHEEIEEILDALAFSGGVPEGAEPYLPDLSNPDPVVGLAEAWAFENWMIATYPSPQWLHIYAHPDGTYFPEARRILGTWNSSNFRYEDFSDSYYLQNEEVVPLDGVTIDDDVRFSLPPGAEAIVYEVGAGERTRIHRETGELVEVLEAYGPTRALAIMVPTTQGWRVFYSELDYAG